MGSQRPPGRQTQPAARRRTEWPRLAEAFEPGPWPTMKQWLSISRGLGSIGRAFAQSTRVRRGEVVTMTDRSTPCDFTRSSQ